MDKFLIKGGKALRGSVAVSGAKNSALPVMAAALLTSDKVVVRNVPRVRDLVTMSKLLAFMDAKVTVAAVPASVYEIAAPKLNHAEAPYELVKTMRASILTLGPLMARVGVARVSLPGGCAIGARPVDLHLKALEQMGAEIATSHGYIEAKVHGNSSSGRRLRGAHIVFEKITVTGTENILMAAALAEGETVLENAAREPEVTDLIAMLRRMGAEICGDGTSTLRIRGVKELHGTEHTVIPDRIEAGTFLVAGAITGGDLTIKNCLAGHLGAVIAKLQQTGVRIDTVDATTIHVRGARWCAVRRNCRARRCRLRTCAQVRGWCWRAWWPAARRLLIACITSTAGMKGSAKSCALLGLISSAFMPPAHDTAANALLTPGRSYRYFALREGRVRWSNGGRMFKEGMR